MNLVIDIGNTRSKYAVFREDSLIASGIMEDTLPNSILSLKDRLTRIDRCIIASVKSHPSEISVALEENGLSCLVFNSSLKFPFEIRYNTPETLGNDRLAGVAGAYALYPDKDILIIDAGTAITFDIITKSEGYIGGNISAGLEMRYRALHNFTDRLPLQSPQESHELIGQDTSSAIISGVQNGLIFEIEGYLTIIGEKYPQLTVLLTGGDSQFFDNKLKKTIFVVPNLTLIGLNFILNYNAQAF
jgi:type III pantothenate kinase